MNLSDVKNVLKSNIQSSATIINKNINDALDYFTYNDIFSNVNIPEYPTSMRDGYAINVNYDSDIKSFKIVGSSRAGNADPNFSLNENEAVYITTGALLPRSANTVVMIEYTEIQDDTLIVKCKLEKDEWIRQIGSDIEKSSLVLKKNSKLGYCEIGLLISLGIKNIDVYKKNIVAVISTGDEITDINDNKESISSIYDSNRPMILSYLNSQNILTKDYGIVKDDMDVMYSKIKEIIENPLIDVLITSGGVSMGDKDFIKPVIQKLGGEILIEKINLKPGKPMIFSKIKINDKYKYVFSLPGNPVSSMVGMMLFVLPSLKFADSGCSRCSEWLDDTVIKAYTTEIIKPDKFRPEYMRGIVQYSKKLDKFFVKPTSSNQISSNIKSMINANCLIEVNPSNKDLDKYSKVNIFLLNNQIEKYNDNIFKIGVLTLSDRASQGVYDDKSGLEIINYIKEKFNINYEIIYYVIPDEKHLIEEKLIYLSDVINCNLILTTGGTGPTLRDVTVEVTEKVCHKLLPGFGEVMRAKNFDKVPTTILSAQTAGIRFFKDDIGSLIVNLPGSPKSIKECLDIIVPSFSICMRIINAPNFILN